MTEKKKEKNEKKIIIMYSRFLFNKYYTVTVKVLYTVYNVSTVIQDVYLLYI